MKRKISGLILALLLIVTLISCDAAISVMGAMGNNILGVDKSKLNSAVDSVKVSKKTEMTELEGDDLKANESTTLEKGAKAFNLEDSDGEKLSIKVGKSNGEQVLVIEGQVIPVSTDVDLLDIVSILPSQDLTAVADALGSSGKSKEAMLAELNKTVTDENTKESARGTAIILRAILGLADSSTSSSESSSRSLTRGDEGNATTGEVLDIIGTVKKNLDAALEGPEKLTMGDVVVLQVFTNVVSVLADDVATLMDALTGKGGTDMSAVLNDIYKKDMALINQTINILASASGTSSILKGAGVSELISQLTK